MSSSLQGRVHDPIPSSDAANAGAERAATGRAATESGPLTVVLVSTQRKWHGGEGQARLLARGLRQRGHHCSILARRNGVFAAQMASEGFEVATFSGNGRSLSALWRIRRHLCRVRPHVLHYNDPHAMTCAGLASLGLDIPARVASRRVDFAVRWAFRYRTLSDQGICVSRAVARVCREGGISPELIRVVHEGVDPSRVRSGDRRRGRQALGLSDEQPLLLTVATLTDHKGHTFLLDAMPAVVRAYPKVCLALAGDGQLTAALQAQAKRLGIDGSVRFLGYRDDVPDLINAADLFVLPSQMEGLCTTLIDVMLAGKPIATTTAGGIPDLTGSNDPDCEPVAWTVPPRDSGALAEAICEALASPEKCAVFQDRARLRAEQLFTADHMLDSTLSVYRELLGAA
jgi:glycosyltransferase involved in cell wall biosynthesis